MRLRQVSTARGILEELLSSSSYISAKKAKIALTFTLTVRLNFRFHSYNLESLQVYFHELKRNDKYMHAFQ